MFPIWNRWILFPALAVAAVGIFIWKKKKRMYIQVGKVSKLFFYPVKSLPGIEVSEGACTKLGFVVNDLLDRSFMLISEDNDILFLSKAPTLIFLSTQIVDNKLIISGPDVDPLIVDIEAEANSKDEIIECKLDTDIVSVIDCGEKLARWFQHYLKKPNIRLVRYYPELPKRMYMKKNPFYKELKSKNPVGLQNLSAFHILSQPSLDNLNQRIGEGKISAANFRPNILVEGCPPYAEDTWEYMKFGGGAEMVNALPLFRCLLTTFEYDTGILTQKEPLATLRKYRIPKDPELRKKTGPLPCLGTACYLLKKGQIKIHDDIFASVTAPPEMKQK